MQFSVLLLFGLTTFFTLDAAAFVSRAAVVDLDAGAHWTGDEKIATPTRAMVLNRHAAAANQSYSGQCLEDASFFIAVTVMQPASWCGSRLLACTLFAATLIASVLTYLHHASDHAA